MDVFFIVATTHWDREWYRTFNDFRIRLCDVMDELLDILDSDENFKCFTFDGQSVVIEDYLKIYPDRKQKLMDYIKNGRIKIGPWYVIPDELIPSGESTIRNLMLGHEICREFGSKLMCGYLPDNFGHASQLPQILKNFNIDNALMFRGMDKKVSEKSEFIWEGADGTRILSEYMIAGYWNLKSWGKLNMDPVTHFKKVADILKQYASTRFYLMLNGADHLYPQRNITCMIEEVKKAIPSISVVNGSIQDFMDAVKSEVDLNRLKVVKGELRYGKDAPVNPSVASIRHEVKFENFKCERELEKYSEPLNTLAYICGSKYLGGFIKESYKELIKNQCHDSICGCSSDDVMRDVMTRFKHSFEISSRISEMSFEYLNGKISGEGLLDDERLITVYNPLNWNRTDMVEAVIDFPAEENIKDIIIFDSSRNEVPYELMDVYEEIRLREFRHNSKEKRKVKVYKVKFMAEDVPSFGYKCFIVRPLKLMEKRRYQQYKTLINFDRKIENEYYIITPDADGTITIYNKKDNTTCPKMHLLEDRGDAGDEYIYSSPFVDEVVYPTLKSVSIIQNTPLQSTMKLQLDMLIPEKLDSGYFKRSDNRVNCPVTTYITLYRGIDRIDFKTVIENNASDHIMSVKFPAEINSDREYSHMPFDVVMRQTETETVNDEDNETPMPFKPCHLFVNIHDNKRSLTLINKGIYEYQTKKNDGRLELQLTLIRSVRWLFREVLPCSRDGQPCTTPVVYAKDAAVIGKHVFEYAIVLGKGDAISEGAYKSAYEFNYGLRAAYNSDKPDGVLPLKKSFINMSDDRVILSSVKKHSNEEAVIARLYNISNDTVNLKISSSFDAARVYKCNMLEENLEELNLRNNEVSFIIKPKEIITLKFI